MTVLFNLITFRALFHLVDSKRTYSCSRVPLINLWKVLYVCFNDSNCAWSNNKKMCYRYRCRQGREVSRFFSLPNKASSFYMFSSLKNYTQSKFVKSWNLPFTRSFTTFDPQYQLGILIVQLQVNSTAIVWHLSVSLWTLLISIAFYRCWNLN